MATYSDVLAKRLLELCEERGLSINKLATASGVAQSTVDNIMRGNSKNPSIRTLQRLASGLNMRVSELLDFPELEETIMDNE